MSAKLKKVLKNSKILCLCEGSSEEGIMNLLIDNDELIFKKEQLIQKKVHRRISVRKVEKKFLGYDYGENLVILRIIDSANEQFNLKKVYKENPKIKVETCLTTPEIEILIIVNEDFLDEYYKVKSKKKPSEFCKQKFKMNDVKKSGVIIEYFENNSKKLIEVIKIYNRKFPSGSYGLYDLIEEDE